MQSLECVDLGDKFHKNELFMVNDPEVECFKGSHNNFMYYLAIPMIVIYMVLIPMGIPLYLRYGYKEELYDENEKINRPFGMDEFEGHRQEA